MNRRNGWVSLAAVILAVLFLLPQTAAYAADLNETELEIEEILLDETEDGDWLAGLFSDEEDSGEPEAEPEPERELRRQLRGREPS